MLLRTAVLSASFTAILANYVVATPMGQPLRSTDQAMSLEYHAPSYPPPPSLPHPPREPYMPKAYTEKKLTLSGLSYSPSSSNPAQEKHKSEERPYVSPPLSLLPSLPSKEEKPKAHEKDYPSAPPKKSYPEKPKTEGMPSLPLPMPPPLFSPTPPPSKASTEKPKIEKKPEEKSDVLTASKEDKPKPSDKPKFNEKPHSPPPSPQKPHSQEKDEQDKQKNQAPKTGDTKVGCTAGKCRRVDPVTCDIPLFRSSDSNSTPSEFRVR